MSAAEMVECLCACGCRERIYPQSGTVCAQCQDGECLGPTRVLDEEASPYDGDDWWGYA